MKTWIQSWLIGLICCCALVQSAEAQFSYTNNGDGTCAITGYSVSTGGPTVVIPDTIGGLKVTSIGPGAFANMALNSITISTNVVSIGDYAFEVNNNLTGIVIPNSVTNLGAGVFAQCQNLTSITLSTNLISIGYQAFYQCINVGSLTIPRSITHIGDYAFQLINVTCIVIFQGNAPPDSGNAFGDNSHICYYLNGTAGWGSTFGGSPTQKWPLPGFAYTATNGVIAITNYTGAGGAVVVPDNVAGIPVTSIGQSFLHHTSVTSVTIPDSVTNIESQAFAVCPGLANVTIGTNVASIGDQAFYNCVALTNVAIPNSVTKCGSLAFNLCSGLTSIAFGSGVTNIAADALVGCTRLAAITVDAANLFYSSADGVLFDKNQTGFVQFPPGKSGSYTIPDSVTSVRPQTFLSCYGLTGVAIGSGVTNIGASAFDSCTNLTGIWIPDNVTSIGSFAFYNCVSLTNVSIGNGVTNVPDDAFYYCISLRGIVIPNNVASIGGFAFFYCSGLTNVTVGNGVTNITDFAFYECTNLTTITVDPANSFYSSANGILFDKNQTTLIQFPLGQTGNYTFPNSVTNIENSAFVDCHLTTVMIPKYVTVIQDEAFGNCTVLTSAFFQGNAPPDLGDAFDGNHNVVYYLPGTTGWHATFGGVPAVLWNPHGASFSVAGGQFGFNLVGPTNAVIIVEAATNLTNPVWLPVVTNTLTGGVSGFSDPDSQNYPERFYRFRSP